MAKRKHHRRRRSTTVKTTHRRRRRRMSAGGAGVFKAVSDPIIGGIAGGLAGLLVKKVAKKFVHDNDLIAAIIPVAGGFLLKKKAPYFAAGMVATPLLAYAVQKFPALQEMGLNEYGNTSFADDLLLSAPKDEPPILLSNPIEDDDILHDANYQLNDDFQEGEILLSGGFADMDDSE
jgi:hypothetical protein